MLAFIEIEIFVSESGCSTERARPIYSWNKNPVLGPLITEVAGYNSKSSKDFRL